MTTLEQRLIVQSISEKAEALDLTAGFSQADIDMLEKAWWDISVILKNADNQKVR